MKLRILNVITTVDAKGGGPIEWVRQYGLAAQDMGHAIEVASMDPPDFPDVAAFPLKVHGCGGNLGGFWSSGLLRFLRRRAADYQCVIVHGLWRFPSFGTWLALRKGPVPYFVYPHGMLDPWFNQAYPRKALFKKLYWPLTDFLAVRDARAVLFTCQEEMRLAATSFAPYAIREGLCLPLGIAPPPEGEGAQRAAFLERFPELDGRRYLLFLSRIHPKKGCDLLLEAFAAEAGPDTMLVMAGPDQTGWASELQALARRLGVADRVVWTGMITGDVKWGAIRGAQAFVLPSHQENFGIAVVEAMACGVPVLISDKVNIYREIVADGAGLADADDLPGTRRTLARWQALADSQRQELGHRAQESYRNRFAIASATGNLLQALTSRL